MYVVCVCVGGGGDEICNARVHLPSEVIARSEVGSPLTLQI